MRRSLVVFVVAILASLAAWLWFARSAVEPLGWHHLALDLRPGWIEASDGTIGQRGKPPRRLFFFGSGLPQLGAPETAKGRFGSRLWGIEAMPGERWVWAVELGQRAVLGFRPLSVPTADCRFDYRAAIRHDGTETVVADASIEAPADAEAEGYFAPARVEVALDRWAHQPVEIVLWSQAEGDGCDGEKLAWGTPRLDSFEPRPPTPGSTTRPNVLLIGLDTMRADHLGAYGHTPSQTPAIDRLAAESDLFLEAFSTFNFTNPSFISILTGLWGKSHGVYDFQTPLPEERVTLAERFHDAGWRTFAVFGAGHLAPRYSGLGQGFESVAVPPGQYAAESAVSHAMRWIDDLRRAPEPEAPFFLWLHLFDVHTPHTPPRPFAEGFGIDGLDGMAPVTAWAPRRQLGLHAYDDPVLGGNEEHYFDELRYLDHQLDRVYDFLASRGLLETTLVAVVADHGENFGEQGEYFNHSGLWDATTHVPLWIRRPGPSGNPGRRFEGLVQTIDLAPTLLRLAGLEPHEVDGRDLYELTDGGRGRRAVFAEASNNAARMVRTRDHLLMQSDTGRPPGSGDFLFDLHADPDQTTNLVGRGLAIESELRDLLGRWSRDRRGETSAEAVELTDEERRQLQALGYVDN